MKATDFIFTPTDVTKGLAALSWRHYAGIVAAILAYVGFAQFINGNVSFLIAGLLFMTISGASYRLPIIIAVIGLLCLMILRPFVHDGNALDTLSKRLAVIVFLLLVFGIYKMLFDNAIAAMTGKRVANPPRKAQQTNDTLDKDAQSQTSPQPTMRSALQTTQTHTKKQRQTRQRTTATLQKRRPSIQNEIHPQRKRPSTPVRTRSATLKRRKTSYNNLERPQVRQNTTKPHHLDLSKQQPIRVRKPRPVQIQQKPRAVKKNNRPQGLIQG